MNNVGVARAEPLVHLSITRIRSSPGTVPSSAASRVVFPDPVDPEIITLARFATIAARMSPMSASMPSSSKSLSEKDTGRWVLSEISVPSAAKGDSTA